MNRRAVGVIQKIEVMLGILHIWINDFEHLRLGQLFSNALTMDKRTSGGDLFYVEDYDLLDAVKYLVKLKKEGPV